MYDLNNGGFLALRNRIENEDTIETYNIIGSTESVVKDIRLATRKPYSVEEKIEIDLNGLQGKCCIVKLCRG